MTNKLLNELKKFPEKFDVKVNHFYYHENQGEVGVKFKNSFVWHWWFFHQIDDEVIYLFNHSYSMNTGKSKKGVKHRMNVGRMFSEAVNKQKVKYEVNKKLSN